MAGNCPAGMPPYERGVIYRPVGYPGPSGWEKTRVVPILRHAYAEWRSPVCPALVAVHRGIEFHAHPSEQ